MKLSPLRVPPENQDRDWDWLSARNSWKEIKGPYRVESEPGNGSTFISDPSMLHDQIYLFQLLLEDFFKLLHFGSESPLGSSPGLDCFHNIPGGSPLLCRNLQRVPTVVTMGSSHIPSASSSADDVLGLFSLFLIVIQDNGPILGSHIGSLPVQGCGIMGFKKYLKQLPVTSPPQDQMLI